MDESLLARLAEVVTVNESTAARARLASDLVRRAMPARWVGIYTVADDRVTNEGWSGSGPPAHPTFPVTQGLNGHAIRARSLALSNDVSQDPRYLTNQDDTGSELIVPVFLAGRVVGTLDVESADVGAFDGQDILRYANVAHALQPLWESTG